MATLFTNGMHQSDLVDLIVSIKTKWNAVMVKLDADATLTDDTYVSENALSIPEGIQTTEVKAIRDQGQLVTFLNNAITQFNLVLAKLDADTLAGLDDNYASTLGITDVVGNDSIDGILNAGVDQGALINLLNRWVTNFNALLAKLDADPLAASDYVSSNGMTDTVEEGGSYARLRSIAILILAGSLFGAMPAAAGESVTGDVTSKTAQSLDFNAVVDTSRFKGVSAVAVYADGTPASHNISDGAKSNVTLTVVNTPLLTGKTITINGVTLTQGVDFGVHTTTGAYAFNISTAINAHASLSSIIISSGHAGGRAAGVVFTTSVVVGLGQYSLTANTTNFLWSHPYMQNGLDPAIDISTDLFTKTSHGFTTGLKIVLSTTSANSIPTGLVWGTTYYVSKVGDSNYKLSTSSTNAVAGTAVDITALPGGSTVVLAPLSLAASSAHFKWQASNDNSNWADIAVSSVTWSGTAGSTAWDFGALNYRYLRLKFTGPINGGLNLNTYLNGKYE